jgi:ADP-heptose:LPS heptosyltransferase
MSAWLGCRNLLAVRLDNSGDLVMLGPALRAIKETLPHARLTLLATPAGAAVAPLLPWVDETIVFSPMWQSLGGKGFDPADDRALIDRLAGHKFDGAIIFTSFKQDPHVPGYACYLAGIPLRAGESKEFGGATLTHELGSGPDELHQVERNLRLVESLGFAVRDRRLCLCIPDVNRAEAVSTLAGIGIDPERPFVVIHPGCSAPARRYPADRFAAIAAGLRSRGLPAVVTGTQREQALIDAVVAGSGAVACLAGMSLATYAAVIEAASAVVCGNTLPLHLADAFGTPVVALYSGTDLESQWRPRTVPHRLLRVETPCHPCYLIECPIGQPCLDIAPETAVGAVLELVGERVVLEVPA